MSNLHPLFIATVLISFGINTTVKADTCIPLNLVGGQGNSVTKTVSQPTIPAPFGFNITRNNWNTDWAVPGDRRFQRFVATVSSDNGGTFDIRMYLKYSDQTAGEFFKQEGIQIVPNKPLVMTAKPRPDDEPYQVNLFVNGIANIGNTYTASMVGCQ
jgi:hypothetical protein